jgi:hypothetical protein
MLCDEVRGVHAVRCYVVCDDVTVLVLARVVQPSPAPRQCAKFLLDVCQELFGFLALEAKGVTRVLECYKSVTRVLQECYKSVTRVLQECYKRVSRGR